VAWWLGMPAWGRSTEGQSDDLRTYRAAAEGRPGYPSTRFCCTTNRADEVERGLLAAVGFVGRAAGVSSVFAECRPRGVVTARSRVRLRSTHVRSPKDHRALVREVIDIPPVAEHARGAVAGCHPLSLAPGRLTVAATRGRRCSGGCSDRRASSHACRARRPRAVTCPVTRAGLLAMAIDELKKRDHFWNVAIH
jgi:hypothetical protein